MGSPLHENFTGEFVIYVRLLLSKVIFFSEIEVNEVLLHFLFDDKFELFVANLMCTLLGFSYDICNLVIAT